MGADYTIQDNSKEVIEAKNNAVEKALEMIGLKAEGYAKLKCPVDTGLLRNSITYAVSGKSPALGNYHASMGSNRIKSGKNAGKRYSSGSSKAGSVGYGSYSGTIGNAKEEAVYIGTNVEYAPYVEMGTQRTKAQPFIKPAATEHSEEYIRIAKSCLQNA